MKYCTQCGERQTEGARFCSGCGVPLAKPADADDNDASSPPATAAAPQPPPPPPYAHYPAPPPPPYAGYPGGAPGVPPVDLGAEYSALYLQHYHAALAAITAQQQQQYAQGHYAGAYPGGYPAYDPHAAHPYGATAAPRRAAAAAAAGAERSSAARELSRRGFLCYTKVEGIY